MKCIQFIAKQTYPKNAGIYLAFLGISCSLIATAQLTPHEVRVNQVGLYPGSSKIASIVTTDTGSLPCQLIDKNSGKVVWEGVPGSPIQSAYSGTITRTADFSTLQQPGTYQLKVNNQISSPAFEIKNQVNHPVAVAALKAFYYQRASMALTTNYAGIWSRAEGHPDTSVIIHASAAFKKRREGDIIAAPGGWYDAGDYNKYVVNSGISTATILSAYEDFPAYFDTLDTHIPESRNALPDILDEALYNIRWLLTMQDPQDGGVYNKCTNAAFDGMVMPDKATAPRYVVQKGTTAALNLVAVMAQASRIFRKFNTICPGLADSCLAAAQNAWNWAEQNPDVPFDQDAMNRKYKPVITTGGYGDSRFTDEWAWAASELLASTGQKKYFDKVLAQMNDKIGLPGWNYTGILAYYTLLRTQKQMPEFALGIIRIMHKRVVTLADGYISKIQSNAFHTVMGYNRYDFVWGSNGIAANQGVLLINAYRITGDQKYLDGALNNIDYLLGRNATGYCFVTGTGEKSPMHPHHRISVADGIIAPVPGLLVGGPNAGMEDGRPYLYKDPETAYIDDEGAYACNEIAINWNAPLVYLLGAAEALDAAKTK